MKSEYTYRICTRCVMDTSAKGIEFDENGVCSYCTEFLARSHEILNKSDLQKEKELGHLIKRIKTAGVGKPYDCIVGVSGGVDSSWVLVKVIELGLRPLAVHMDNGWNSELAQNNISNLINKLGVDLYTHVVNWGEYKQLMQAFLDADVIDVELLYDNAMLAVNYTLADRYNIKYILGGTNQSTEGMKIPSSWNWFKYDKRNIYGIAKRFSSVKIKTLPTIGTWDYVKLVAIKKIEWVSILDYYTYNKFETLDALEENFGYKRYPYKHYESIFTRFYQGYLLPNKFHVDKRRVHLATLVVTNQLGRDAALTDLGKLPYPTERDLAEDRGYFLKKMDWTEDDLRDYLTRSEVPHNHYPSEIALWQYLAAIYRKMKRARERGRW